MITFGDPVFWLRRVAAALPGAKQNRGSGNLGNRRGFGMDPKAPGVAQPSLKTGWGNKWGSAWNR